MMTDHEHERHTIMPVALAPGWTVMFLMLVVLACGGCAYKFPEYAAKPVSQCMFHMSESGLRLGADPLFDARTARRYFDSNLPRRGILAVYVVVENNSANETYLIKEGDFQLEGTGAHEGQVDRGREIAGTAIAMHGAIVVSPLLLFVGASMAADAANVDSNMRAKALRTGTIAPGESLAGFVYFQMPKDASQRPESWQLGLHADSLTRQDRAVVRLAFEGR